MEKIYNFSSVINEFTRNVYKTDYYRKKGFSEELISRYKLGYLENGAAPLLESFSDIKFDKSKADTYKYIIPYIDGDGGCSYFIICCDNNKSEYIMKIDGMCPKIYNEKCLTSPSLGYSFIYVTDYWENALSFEELGYSAIAINGNENIQLFLSILNKNKNKLKEKVFVLVGEIGSLQYMNETLKEGILKTGLSLEYYKFNKRYKNINEFFLKDREGMKKDVGLFQVPINVHESTYKDYEIGYLYSKFIGGKAIDGEKRPISTGFDKLDRLLKGGLHEGELTVFAGESGIGKTSLMLQISDFIAQNGQYVLYFTMCERKFELSAKSLTRILYSDIVQNDISPETRELVDNKVGSDLIFRAISVQDAAAKKMQIIEGNNDTNVIKIKSIIMDNIKVTGKRPVVIIDCIQNLGLTNRLNQSVSEVYNNTIELKRISKDLNISILLISSINIENYYKKLNYTSFQGLVNIENIADNIMILNLYGIELLEEYDSKAEIIKKYHIMKSAIPRKVQLDIIKQRMGPSNVVSVFSYFPQYNYFKEIRE